MANDNGLGEHFEQFISDQLAAGNFDNREDVIRAGLASLEGQEASCHWSDDELRQAIRKADDDIAAGRLTVVRSSVDADALFNEIKEQGQERLATARTK